MNTTRWRWLGYGGFAILAALEANEIVRSHASMGRTMAVIAVTAIIGAAWIPLMLRSQRDRRSWLGPVLISIMGAASVALDLLTPNGASIIAAIAALAMAARRFDVGRGAAFAVALIAAYVLASASNLGFAPITLFSIGLGLTFAYVASTSIARLREEEARARELLAELQASRDAQLQSAALNERARIAREIHDVLAHTLAALAVQLESARVLLERDGSNREALATVERSHRLVKEGLEEVGRAVSALRGDRIPGPSQIRDLVSEFEADTGVESDFQVGGQPRQLEPEAQLALYRTAQEALTNVRKHAAASRVEVSLRYEADGTELRIADVGSSADSANGGYGLVGMRERAELLGGKLDAGSTADGFEVRLFIPA